MTRLLRLIIYILACTDDEKQRLAFELGRSKRKSISTDFSEIGSIYRNIEFLKSLDVCVSQKAKKGCLKCVALGQIYKLTRNKTARHIFPHHYFPVAMIGIICLHMHFVLITLNKRSIFFKYLHYFR